MKKLLLILSLFVFSLTYVKGQSDDDNQIGDKMREYIQQKLRLNKQEAKTFAPIFLQYFRDWRNTLREYRTDKLMLRKQIVDLQLKYRNEFRNIIGDRRGSEVFRQQEIFIEELQNLRRERLRNKLDGPPRGKTNNLPN